MNYPYEYQIRTSETGEVLEEFNSYTECEDCIYNQEQEDISNGVFTNEYYYIYNTFQMRYLNGKF